MKLLDLFAGIGGFSHGLKMAGMELVGFCEIDKQAHRAFKILHDPEERLWSAYDVRTIDPIRLPDFDCMCFGWPCQDNSIAGKRTGQREGTRSGLLYEATRILRFKRPRYFIAENVTGLFTVNHGRDFYETIREFTDVGYDVQWGVLNSSAYVPQNRERIFFVGHLRGERRPEIFPFGGQNENAVEVIGRVEAQGDDYIKRVYNTEGISPCLPTMQGGGQIPKIYCVNPRKADGSQTYQQDRVYRTEGVLPALTSQLDGRFNVLIDGAVRELTPLECFRLQSFPDEWYYKLEAEGFKKTQLYKMAGNAVTSRVAYEIGLRLARSAFVSTESAQ
ncbi:DNA cytosine methyltransferase [Cohnella sp. JJ-181]|uniref:DNA cytosine methyltransferase n=1 Tax=Cohnella rhizoplanae TaxID=2974897 RepID=UPI0022FF9C2C|nr:DNA (cytosine-5-)-methyltransferase [Cohnella sp. JJ-181]CAI6073112.1 IS1595 family transposase ISCco3 [Cohnella sp. JJ-181]